MLCNTRRNNAQYNITICKLKQDNNYHTIDNKKRCSRRQANDHGICAEGGRNPLFECVSTVKVTKVDQGHSKLRSPFFPRLDRCCLFPYDALFLLTNFPVAQFSVAPFRLLFPLPFLPFTLVPRCSSTNDKYDDFACNNLVNL